MEKAKKYQGLIKKIQGEYLVQRYDDAMPDIRQKNSRELCK